MPDERDASAERHERSPSKTDPSQMSPDQLDVSQQPHRVDVDLAEALYRHPFHGPNLSSNSKNLVATR
jgi:hypothetical protein